MITNDAVWQAARAALIFSVNSSTEANGCSPGNKLLDLGRQPSSRLTAATPSTLQCPDQHGNALGRVGSRAAVGNHRQPTATRQQLSGRQDVREDGTVVVDTTTRSGDLQAAGPEAIEARLFDQLATPKTLWAPTTRNRQCGE